MEKRYVLLGALVLAVGVSACGDAYLNEGEAQSWEEHDPETVGVSKEALWWTRVGDDPYWQINVVVLNSSKTRMFAVDGQAINFARFNPAPKYQSYINPNQTQKWGQYGAGTTYVDYTAPDMCNWRVETGLNWFSGYYAGTTCTMDDDRGYCKSTRGVCTVANFPARDGLPNGALVKFSLK